MPTPLFTRIPYHRAPYAQGFVDVTWHPGKKGQKPARYSVSFFQYRAGKKPERVHFFEMEVADLRMPTSPDIQVRAAIMTVTDKVGWTYQKAPSPPRKPRSS